MTELRQKLTATPERSRFRNCRRHQLQYSKALVKIISMVKHAAHEEEPLYPAEELVQQAFEKVTDGKRFTEEQQQWLDRIREHMMASLSIDKEDFDVVPIFARYGGWTPANRTFNDILEDIIRDLNAAIAA